MKGPRRSAPFLYDEGCQDRRAVCAGARYRLAHCRSARGRSTQGQSALGQSVLGKSALGASDRGRSAASAGDHGSIAKFGRRPSQDQAASHDAASLRDRALAPPYGGYSG
jgi:hypothetical protein